MTTPSSSPYALGKFTTNAGTKVCLTSDTDLYAHWIDIQALETNASAVFIGSQTMNTTTLVGVLKVLYPGDSWAVPGGPGNTLHVADFYLDVTTNGEGIQASCYVL